MDPKSLKRISKQGIPSALEKADRYRLLNEPSEAESICRDVLSVEPDNKAAILTLLLSISDQFTEHLGARFDEANALADRLGDEYGRCYYRGLICERRAKAQYRGAWNEAGRIEADWLHRAQEWYEKAERLSPDGNDLALLRWNACQRLIEQHSRPEDEAPGSDRVADMLE